MTQSELQAIRDQFIEAAGNLTQTFGLGRIIGQIFAHIYFSRLPQSLDGLTQSLRISKGSASMAVRQLEQWGALRKVWIRGERKDHYETTDQFGRVIRRALIDIVGQNLEAADRLLEESDAAFRAEDRGAAAGEDAEFLRRRITRLRDIRKRAQGLWESPVIRMLMK